jgi:tRNA(Ile)-lysidine synthase
MIARFREFIRQRALFDPEDEILVAVSGGIDSMVLWRLFEESEFRYGVIHCNFQLRGEDSMLDEQLVRDQAAQRGVRLFVRRFDTLEYAEARGISVEMAARELRYEWFEEVRSRNGYRYIATAHHQDDLLETFFINLVRKTGIRGLTGFREKSGTLIRPLLFAGRKEIEAFSVSQDISFRKDYTNDEIIFQRNFIRHQIIPGLEKLNPAFRSNLSATMENLRKTEEVYQSEISKQLMKISCREGEFPAVYLSQLLKLPNPEIVLFEWMSRYGFQTPVISALYAALPGETGSQYFSRTHRLVIDRNKLIITPIPGKESPVYYLEEGALELMHPFRMVLERVSASGFRVITDPTVACLDAGKLVFPLIIRKWQPGEYFQPLGMQGFKKLSDFFVDEKFSLPEKEGVWVLYSENKVVWIIGHRIDHRFRITSETGEVMIFRLTKS